MIPDFQSIMLPLLKALNNDSIKTASDLRKDMISYFNITESEQQEKIPSGKQYVFYNRIAWAIAYLKMAGLISSPRRGEYQITIEGKRVLNNPPEKITISFLKQFPTFSQNRNYDEEDITETNKILEKTPDELIDIGFKQLQDELSTQLINQVKNCTPDFFEKLVVDLLIRMGYGGSDIGNGEVTQRTNDEGIDGIIKEDKLGLDKIYLQAKKWDNVVGRPEIQRFVGALQGKKAKKGIFITTSTFSKDAYDYVNNIDCTIILIDGKRLTELMIENEVGVSTKRVLKICKVDTDYFIEE